MVILFFFRFARPSFICPPILVLSVAQLVSDFESRQVLIFVKGLRGRRLPPGPSAGGLIVWAQSARPGPCAGAPSLPLQAVRRPAAATVFQTIVVNWGVNFPNPRVTTGVSCLLGAVAPCRSLGGFCRAPQLLFRVPRGVRNRAGGPRRHPTSFPVCGAAKGRGQTRTAP